MAKELDCSLEITEFELQSRYCCYFRTNTLGKEIKPSYSLSYGLNSITAFLVKNDFGICL